VYKRQGIENYDYISIACGSFDFFIIIYKLQGKKVLRVWTGTDVLKSLKFWDYRIRAKICGLFCNHVVEAPWLVNELESIGIKANYVKHTFLL